MKFWELTDTFRDETDIVEQVLGQSKWLKYYQYYKRLEQIVKNQERDILDEELPFDLCYEVASKSKKTYWLAYNEQPQTLYSYQPGIEYLERMSCAEALTRFGARKLFEAYDWTYTEVGPG